MRSVVGGMGVSALTALLAVVTWKQVDGSGDGPGAPPPPAGHRSSAGSPGPTSQADCREAEKVLDDFSRLYGAGAGPTGLELRHLMVLVPDPVATGGPELFDLVREGVAEAVADHRGRSEYVQDRQWLPWTATDDGSSVDDCPGVAVFRPAAGLSRELPGVMVLYVGETPSLGLRITQFDRAMALVDRYGSPEQEPRTDGVEPTAAASDGDAECRRRHVNILGPTFSGSAASLAAAIDRHRGGGRRFAVVSATVTSPKVPSILVPGAASAEACARPRAEGDDVAFEAVAADDGCLLSRMQEFLTSRGARCGTRSEGANVVVFTEASTYGAIDAGAAGARDDEAASCFMHWKLPPDLPAIRASAAGTRDTPAPGGASPAVDQPRGLRSPEAVRRHTSSLESSLDWLSRRGVRFAGLMLTDPKDVMFLARRFRQRYPDIRLFTLGTSSAYQDEDFADALNGMLVVDSIPRDRHNSMALQNEVVRKVYFAGQRLLTGDPLPDLATRVSFIGNGRIWKLAETPETVPASGRGSRTPVAWQFVFAVFIVLYGAVIVIVYWGLWPATWAGRRTGAWALVAPCSFPDLRARDGVLSALLLLVAGGAPVLMLEATIARDGQAPDHWMACLVAVGLMFLPPGVLWLRRRLVGVPTDRPRPCRFDPILVAAILVMLSLALYIGCGPERTATLHLLSGGSPVLVGLIAMASFGLTLWCARTRLRMLDGHRSFGQRSFLDAQPPIARALGEEVSTEEPRNSVADVERLLMEGLLRPSSGWLSMVGVHALLAATLVAPICIRPPHTLEPGWRNVALVALGIVATLPASLNIAWYLTAWARLLRLLNRLAPSSAVRALGHVRRQRRSLNRQLAFTGSQATERRNVLDSLRRLLEADAGAGGSDPSIRERSRWEVRDTRDGPELRPAESGEPAGGGVERRGEGGAGTPVKLEEFLVDASGKLMKERPRLTEPTRRRVEELAALLIDLVLPRYIRQLRLFAPPMVLGCLCCVFLGSLYFAQPQRLIAMISFFWAAVTVAVALASYISLDVDPVISAVAGSGAGRISSWFALGRKVVAWGSVPVASYLAVEHPQFSLWVSHVLDFVGKSLR